MGREGGKEGEGGRRRKGERAIDGESVAIYKVF